MNPCDTPCPKCGSGDVSRNFIAYGALVPASEYGRPKHKWLAGDAYSFRAIRDLIQHQCRVCTYLWAGPVMKKPRLSQETSETKGETP